MPIVWFILRMGKNGRRMKEQRKTFLSRFLLWPTGYWLWCREYIERRVTGPPNETHNWIYSTISGHKKTRSFGIRLGVLWEVGPLKIDKEIAEKRISLVRNSNEFYWKLHMTMHSLVMGTSETENNGDRKEEEKRGG